MLMYARLGLLVVGLLLAAVALAGWATSGGQESTQASAGFSVGVDVDATGNTATSLDGIETSRIVACGEAFDIDIYVTDVTDLLVWNVTFQYAPTILGVYARDVQMFLAASPGSDVKDHSYGDPGFTGNYDLLASDVADPPAPESGSGVLARLSITALAPGLTRAQVAPVLFFGTSGPMWNPPAVDAQIAVTGDCGLPGDSDDDGFNDSVESYTATDPFDSCPDNPSDDAWPPDINKDTRADVLDALLFKPVIMTQVGDPTYNPRFDLNADGRINIVDVLLYAPVIMTQCTNP